MALHTEKYKQAILYLCSKLGKEVRGKKKLAKLLYFVDFDFFEKNQKYFTGDKYKALPMGPVPVSLNEITREMTKEKTLKIESVNEHNGYNPTEVYTCLKDPKISVFSVLLPQRSQTPPIASSFAKPILQEGHQFIYDFALYAKPFLKNCKNIH